MRVIYPAETRLFLKRDTHHSSIQEPHTQYAIRSPWIFLLRLLQKENIVTTYICVRKCLFLFLFINNLTFQVISREGDSLKRDHKCLPFYPPRYQNEVYTYVHALVSIALRADSDSSSIFIEFRTSPTRALARSGSNRTYRSMLCTGIIYLCDDFAGF